MTCDFLTQRNNGWCGSAVTFGPSCQTNSRHVNLTFTENYHKQGWHRGYNPSGYTRLNLLSTWREYTTYLRSCEWFMIKRRSFRERNIQALPEMPVVVVGVHHQLIKECLRVCPWAHLIPCLVCSNCCKIPYIRQGKSGGFQHRADNQSFSFTNFLSQKHSQQ